MNQSILFNDDIEFNKKNGAWSFSGMISGEVVTIYFHSISLCRLSEIDSCTKYDLEEIAELWIENNEPEGNEIHIKMKN